MNDSEFPNSLPPPVPPVPEPPQKSAAYNPYSPPVAMVADVSGVDLNDLPQASRVARFFARFIDNFLIALGFFSCGLLGVNEETSETASVLVPVLVFVLLLLLLGVVQLILLVRNGQTLGKKAMGIKIVRLDNSRASGGRLVFLRSLLIWGLNIVPFFSLIDALFIFREDQRCIHDLVADTKVVLA